LAQDSQSFVPAKEPKREFKVGDKIRVNLDGKIEDAVVRAVIQGSSVISPHTLFENAVSPRLRWRAQNG